MKNAVALRGANNPKLTKSVPSQKTTTTRNGMEIEDPLCSNRSERICPKLNSHRLDLRFKRALRVVLRYQFLDLVEQDLVAGLGGGRGPRLCHFCPKSDRAFLRPHC